VYKKISEVPLREKTRAPEMFLELEMRLKLKRRDMLGERGSGSKWDMRGPAQRGSDTRQTSVIYIPIISDLFTTARQVIRLLVYNHKHAGARFKRNQPFISAAARFMECFYCCWEWVSCDARCTRWEKEHLKTTAPDLPDWFNSDQPPHLYTTNKVVGNKFQTLLFLGLGMKTFLLSLLYRM